MSEAEEIVDETSTCRDDDLARAPEGALVGVGGTRPGREKRRFIHNLDGSRGRRWRAQGD